MKYLGKELRTLLLLITLVFQSCGSDYKGSLQKIIDNKSIVEVDKYNTLVLIPGSGCTGCITRSEEYFLNNCHDESILFVLTYNFSLKEVALRLKEENIRKANVIIDQKNEFYLTDYEEKIYPVICDLENGRIVRIGRLN